MRPRLLSVTTVFVLATSAGADGPGDNVAAKVRRIPPEGIAVPDEDRTELKAQLLLLGSKLKDHGGHPLLPDVEIFYKAVRYALDYDEFQKPAELKLAREFLKLGIERADALKAGEAPWTKQTGLVVRGFRSKIDGSVQPYGLVIPDAYDFDADKEHRLDFWFHGRDETVNEIGFIHNRLKNPGQYTPADTIVLHPYARYSNANKFAGEIDCLEALEHVRSGYRIDPDRILVRGFSMGGAACWQFAVHYPDRWCAANPGAGFAETEQFLKSFQGETLDPAPYQRKLWHLYDCTDYAANLTNLPTVAYSGEIDRQKQAADIMAEAMAEEGLTLTHIIGPETAHAIHPDSKKDVESRLDAIAEIGRQIPKKIKFVTYTLRYNRHHWLTIDHLGEHWKEARFEAEVVDNTIKISRADNIQRFTLSFPESFLDPDKSVLLEIGGKVIEAGKSNRASFELGDDGWAKTEKSREGLDKKHRLQGPIDDAFMDSFKFVIPGAKTRAGLFGQWEESERSRAITHWRQQFRGDARIKLDSEISDEDIASHNLILWGNPSTNVVLAKIADKLPIRWTEKSITAGDRTFDSATHALVMIYPNPLNPERYVVLNSGFTYREYDYLNNARQIPKLPDWAVIDILTEKPGTQRPGKIVGAGFFDEGWQIKK